MYGNLFLSSVFQNLSSIRDFIWREVQKQSMLKCISFQTEHVLLYPATIRGEIRDAIEGSDFFIVLIGPQYGTKISGSGLPSDDSRDDWDLSFGHWELELALQRLASTTKPHSKVPITDPVKRLLLVNLVTKANSSLSDLRRLREYAAQKADQLGVIFETIQVRLPGASKSKKSRARQYQISDPGLWEAKLRGFLSRANDLSEDLMHEKSLKTFPIERNRNIHVAGWSGIEENKLYEAFISDGYHSDSFSFLTMDRSLIEVPSSTRYFPRLEHPFLQFDFLFSDIEVVNFHKERGYIGPLAPLDGESYIRARFADSSFSANVRRHRESFYPNEQLHAVPLLYGFNEIITAANSPILNANKAAGQIGPASTSYSAFDLPTLLGQGRSVVLWGWWVVTFPIILLAHATAVFEQRRAAGEPFTDFLGLKETHIQSVRTFSDWIMNFARNSPQEFELCIGLLVTSIRDAYQKHPDPASPKVVRSLDTLTHVLRDGDADVVLGGTSAVLATCRETERQYETIIPKEGVFTWINCICPTPNAKADFLGKIVEHWSKPDTQIRLSLGVGTDEVFDPSVLSKQYVGIPANQFAERIFCDKIQSSPQLGSIHRTLRALAARKVDPSLGSSSWVRPFPQEQAAFLMEYYWNVLTRELNADFKR
ncbi:hypothetical protein UNPF46_21390 [Bradyrhizobium sp. UNPF46]|uniref:DUF4062 domain-containing protein n=1 Tax=Bradyrhizobium sp. UNPF46 TaxID=1141168 RepID=UPI0011516710|nr:DUF4062 domain-containing protein [Bradyrhizobium sp. UNPF46]TQF36709.1 hypothetical protein UNPF46_21390 [Bradyrhizobium sp. UNPF46]